MSEEMSEGMYVCKRCGHDAKYKQALEKHLQRRIPCLPTILDISTTALLDELKPKYNDNAVQCDYCKKTFSNRFGLQTHVKTCKAKAQNTASSSQNNDEISVMKERLTVVEEENRLLREQMQVYKQEMKLQQHEINLIRKLLMSRRKHKQKIHVSSTININNFGQESLEHITEEFLSNCMMNDLSGAKELIEKIHFSDEVPQNKTVRMKSVKRKVVEITQDNQWISKRAEEIIDQMIRKCFKILTKYTMADDSDFQKKDERIQERIRTFLASLRDKSNNSPYHTLKERIMVLIEENTA